MSSNTQRGERSPERVTYRNRTWDTRVGTMELHIPKLREGSYFPSLLEPRRRSEKALLAVIQQAYVEGVSTRRVDDLIKALGCDGISSSQVSRICEQLDEVVESFLGRPLDGGPILSKTHVRPGPGMGTRGPPLVSLGDGGGGQAQGGNAGASTGANRQIAGHGEGLSWQGAQVHAAAPAFKEPPLGAVDAAGVVGEDGRKGVCHAPVGGPQG